MSTTTERREQATPKGPKSEGQILERTGPSLTPEEYIDAQRWLIQRDLDELDRRKRAIHAA